MLAALAVIIVLFGIYEVVERRWLGGLTMSQLHHLHQLRGILGAAIAATVASWLILRLPPLFPDAEAAPRTRTTAPPDSAVDRERRFAQWFIQMRWIAMVVGVVLVLASVQIMGYLSTSLLWPLLAILGVLGLMNVAYAAALQSRIASRSVLLAQAYGDLIVLTALLQFSGGIENPLGILMLVHVVIAGIVLSRRQCYLVAAWGSVLFAAMAVGELTGMLPHYMLTIFPHAEVGGRHVHAALEGQYVVSRVGLQVIVLFLTGYFTSTVTRQLQRRERQLETLADEALAQSQLLERSLDTTGSALCVYDATLRPTWVNPRWAELFGEQSGGPDAPGDARARETLKDGTVHVGEVVLPAGGGVEGAPARAADERTFLLTTAPLVDKKGAITHVVELARDVTQLRWIQERVRRAEQLAAVGELAGKVAHEVNNPIAVISAKARLLLSRNRDELSGHAATELVKITELSDKVAHIARGLLTYARPSHGVAAPTDIKAVVGRALSMVETATEAAGVEVFELIPTALPQVHANAVEMEQVFVNLFMNALDAMPDGGRLTVRAAVDAAPDERLSVVVEDTGVGIPHELQDQVFEPFMTTKPQGKGTGLGLAVCLGLVRSHGGEIALESEPGAGTRVYVRLLMHEPAAAESPTHV